MPDSIESRVGRLERVQAALEQRMANLEEMHRALAPLVRDMATLTADVENVEARLSRIHDDIRMDVKERREELKIFHADIEKVHDLSEERDKKMHDLLEERDKKFYDVLDRRAQAGTASWRYWLVLGLAFLTWVSGFIFQLVAVTHG
jgi:chromosome segregation ATPase